MIIGNCVEIGINVKELNFYSLGEMGKQEMKYKKFDEVEREFTRLYSKQKLQ